MKETLLIQTTLGSEKRSQIWNDGVPVTIGKPFRWVIERTSSGVRVRDLVRGSLVRVSWEEIQRGARIELGEPKDRRTQKTQEVFLKTALPIPPAYMTGSVSHAEAEKKSLPMLFAYGGMRRSLVNCTLIHSAYVAYENGSPAFALYHHKEGFRVKTLSAGVRFKLKGQNPTVGEPGTVWEIKKEELGRVTLFRGWHWWRFAMVNAPAPISAGRDLGDDNRLFRRLGLVTGAALLLVSAALIWLSPKSSTSELDDGPIVKLDTRKTKIFLKPAAVQTNHLTEGDAEKQPTVASAPAPVKMPAKPEPKKAPVQQASVAPPQHKPSARELEAKKAVQQAKSLRDALGGLRAMTKAAAPTKTSGIFDGPKDRGAAAALNTDVKPLLSGSQVKVQGIGGTGLGGRGSAAQGMGYAQSGAHGPVAGQGGSYISLGGGGYRADEGLTKEEIGAVIHGHMGEVRYCHEAALLQNPKADGRLVIQFKIDPKGRVVSATTDSSTLPKGSLEECVRTRLLSWMFPKPHGGVFVTISYPFNFKILERE